MKILEILWNVVMPILMIWEFIAWWRMLRLCEQQRKTIGELLGLLTEAETINHNLLKISRSGWKLALLLWGVLVFFFIWVGKRAGWFK